MSARTASPRTRGELGIRMAVGAVGVLGGLYGAYLLVSRQKWPQVRQALEWAVGGVVVHDAVIAPVALGLGWVLARLVPRRALAPLAVALVVIGTMTAAALPVLGRQGVNGLNPTLLDRDYTRNWFLLVGLTLVLAGLGALVARRRGREPARPAAPAAEHDEAS
jgi:LPXTG-motif cell wall-anchored protein